MSKNVYLLQPIVFSIPLCSLRRQLYFKHFLLFFYTAHPPQKIKSIAIPSAPLKKGNCSGEWSLLVKFPYGFIVEHCFIPVAQTDSSRTKKPTVKGAWHRASGFALDSWLWFCYKKSGDGE